MNRLTQIQDWYAAHCDGVWEHTWGVKIDSLDNPGWWVKINLVGTELEHAEFTPRVWEHSKSDWMNCCVKDRVFEGAGDTAKLETILGVFLDWTKQYERPAS